MHDPNDARQVRQAEQLERIAQDRVADEPGLKESSVTLTDLPTGIYYWQVWSTRAYKGEISEVPSERQKVQIGEVAADKAPGGRH